MRSGLFAFGGDLAGEQIGEIVGVLGVIGPTRMAYERVIPIVEVTARLVSSALNSTLNATLHPNLNSGS